MDAKVILIRLEKTKYQTLGRMQVFKGKDQVFYCHTLELPWKNNQKDISCIPAGEYELVYEWSPTFGMMLWEIKGVPGRSECKFHIANFVRQLNGCVALGQHFRDINGDGLLDVTNSKKTINHFHSKMIGVRTARLIVVDAAVA